MTSVIVLAAAGIASMFVGVFNIKRLALPLVLLACLAALGIIMFHYNGGYESLMNNMLAFDAFSYGFSVVMILITMGILVISNFYYRNNVEHLSDIYALFIFSLIGGILLCSYNSLVMLFLGIEILSIPLYILAASNRKNLFSNEAGLKYFLMGSFASCFLLLGITFIYGTANSFDMNVIAQYVNANPGNLSPLFITGAVLILGSFIFKVSAVPFHFWAPDVYQGSPTVITAFMATVVKTAAFGGLIRFISGTIFPETAIWSDVLNVIAILTLIVGNILALYQTNLKRLLAYSGIANAGYILVAVATLREETFGYVLYYLTAYGVGSMIAFTIYFIVKDQTGIDSIAGLKGLFSKNKFLAAVLAFTMLSLAGIPPLAGFFGKYAIFVNAINANAIWLVIIAILTSLIGVYYYLRVMTTAMSAGDDIPKLDIHLSYKIVLTLGVIILLTLGVVPDLFNNLISK
ncbi:MAG: NADH-quinone oxidoreductase subunit N [Chitinophagales bacterium]|jgi:NADH-quinone oxidoreductase subunit N|nr:NADH-quinone oxidoreductase subunit N [Bacteroidota bacterium]MBK9555918.1 NADH-quinone oxidoreductase subunit N [Bacteroidota bacterium]MBL0279311.1 NADH-quinone oxidoreductase subunit N [Bacteroidota bacterium]MBP8250190.1 NADH-quinone oxidoreductase subunit N [Chitinophagales bacterium]